MPNAVLPEQIMAESILFAEVKISKQLKLSDQTAEGTAETTQNRVIQDCLGFCDSMLVAGNGEQSKAIIHIILSFVGDYCVPSVKKELLLAELETHSW